MKKGQTAIDMLLALIIALVFFSVLSVHVDSLASQTRESSIRNGLHSILEGVYSTTASVKAYSLSTEYASAPLKVGQEQAPLNCTISINNTNPANASITVSSTSTNPASQTQYSGLDLSNMNFSATTIGCGEKITISKA